MTGGGKKLPQTNDKPRTNIIYLFLFPLNVISWNYSGSQAKNGRGPSVN